MVIAVPMWMRIDAGDPSGCAPRPGRGRNDARYDRVCQPGYYRQRCSLQSRSSVMRKNKWMAGERETGNMGIQ